MNLTPYFRIMRLHQPVGIWLLLWPCFWSLALAAGGVPPLHLLILFALGAVLMRGAGCIINDILDRDIDKQVERTKSRPLASGELSLTQAFILLLLLLAVSLCIAIALGKAVLLWSALALIPVALYPLMKRITWWPQAFLGITFNLGALMGWVAVKGSVELPAIALYVAGIFWTLGYDTIYAHQDKVDDARIGVKSSALRLGQHTKRVVTGFYLISFVGWGAAGVLAGAGPLYYLLVVVAAQILLYQINKLEIDNPARCLSLFKLNAYVGGIIFVACLFFH